MIDVPRMNLYTKDPLKYRGSFFDARIRCAMTKHDDKIMSDRAFLEQAKHWVIKLGSNVLLHHGWQVDRPVFAGLVQGIDALISSGARVTVVSSGAVALGRQRVGVVDRPTDIPALQALAAIGQSHLIQLYEQEFGFYGRQVAQVLLSRQDLDDRQRYLNARLALNAIDEHGVVPIINENDTVATEELRFGDNDQLAAMTCGVAQADVLVILSDVEGVYDVVHDEETNTRQFTDRIKVIDAMEERLDQIAGPSITGVGTGGMITKIKAARLAARFGVSTIIAPGKQAGILQGLQNGEDLGTLLLPQSGHILGKKVWLSAGARAVGTLVIDQGAARALTERGASLLPSGVVEVRGQFQSGAVVTLEDEQGTQIGRGICVYSAADVECIKGVRTDEIVTRLGYKVLDVVVHRDDLVLV